MTESGEEPFHQNQEAAKRFKPAQKRKQPGTTAFSAASTVVVPPRPLNQSTSASTTSASSSPYSSSGSLLLGSTSNNNNNSNNGCVSAGTSSPGFVYQQPTSIQHQHLPSQTLLPLDPNGFGEWNIRNGSSMLGQVPDLTTAASKAVTAEEMDGLAAMLSETTLSNISYYGPSAAATIADDFDDEDLWGPQIRSVNSAEDPIVPPELQILPDIATRQHLTELYYQNHYLLLPMVQREVLRVCEENIHIPHCLLLCNAVYYCGSMFSTNTLPLRKDMSDEGTVGENFFQRGQALLEKKYLTAHLCTVQSLLLFAIGHKSPAQRSAFISQAITMALDMGLHSKMDDSANKFMRAYRSRVFWCCFIFDSTSSAIGGKPTLINDEEIHVDMVEPGDLGPETENYSDQYMLHCVRGWQICRRIRKNSKLVLMRPPPSKSVLLENLDHLDKDLVDWQEKMPKVFDLVPTRGSITSDVKALAAGAQLLCYALIILLHHPYLPNPKSAEAFQSPQQGGPPDSQGYCTQAAKEITKISGILLKDAPRTFEQNTPSRYALNFAIRIHLRNSKCTTDSTLAKESRRDLQKSMDYVEQVENLQFFRINRSKKSDVADLLASCRAALAQQKSSLDLAREAAAVKHRQLLQAKLLVKDQMRQQQQQQQQQQRQLQQQEQQQQLQQQLQQQQLHAQAQYERQYLQQQLQLSQPLQSSASSSTLQAHRNAMDQHQEHLQSTQQHMHLHQSQLQQQHQAHIQQMKSNLIQQQQQQQQHLQILRRQHHQEQLQRHRQQEQLHRQQPQFAPPIQQQQQQQHLQDSQGAIQHLQSSQHFAGQLNSGHSMPAYQGAVLFQGQPSFAPPTTSVDQRPVQLTQHQQQQTHQDQQVYTSWIADPQQDVPVLYHSSNDQLPGSGGLFGTGEDMIDIQSMVFDPRHEALFSTAASHAFSSSDPVDVNRNMKESTLHLAPNLTEDVFLTSVPRSQTTLLSPKSSTPVASLANTHLTPPLLDNASLSPMTPYSGAPSTVVSPQMHTTSLPQAQPARSYHKSDIDTYPMPGQQSPQPLFSPISKNNMEDNRTTHSGFYHHASTPEHSGSMSSSSVVSSPNGSALMSEEAVLESFRGQMIHDTFFMHVNLPAEHPRNDPTSFVYLPSELEYGDTTALSPAGGGSTNSSEVDALSPRPM